MLYAVVAHPVPDISKVASDKGKSIIVDDVFLCIFILIEAVEMSFGREMSQYFPAVSASAEGDININTVGLDIKPVDALLKEYWNVVCLSRLYHRALWYVSAVFIIEHRQRSLYFQIPYRIPLLSGVSVSDSVVTRSQWCRLS